MSEVTVRLDASRLRGAITRLFVENVEDLVEVYLETVPNNDGAAWYGSYASPSRELAHYVLVQGDPPLWDGFVTWLRELVEGQADEA